LNTQTILRQNEAATHQRNWAAEGIAQLEELLRQENKDLKKLSDSVISFVVNYSKANQGAIFLVNEENSKPVLELQGCYAYGRLKHIGKTIIPGQDLVGQAYLERDIIYLTDVPDQYTQITSGLGEATPSAVILVPLKIEEQIVGVLEMASFNQIEPYQRDFLLKAAQSIASTVLNVRVNITTTQLLERSQQQTEELRAQEEEVRQNMEELSATQEEMARMTKEMESQLSAINDTMATIEFDLEGNILAANSNFLQLMGYELEAIRGKHHRTFVDPTEAGSAAYQEFWTRLAAGHKETGEFKRITRKGQEVYIRGIYSPIIDQNGKPKKILKLAYDITDSKVNELEVQGLMSAIDGSIASIEFSPDGNILNANENFLQVMGYTLAEIRGKHHRMFVEQEERRSDDYAEFWKEIGRGEHKSGEFKRVDSSGNAVYIKGIYNPVLNQAGKVVKVIKLAYDITQSKLMEMEIQQQLEQTQAQEEELRQNMEELSATQEEMSRINREIESQIQSINKTMATIEFDTSGNILAANDNFLELMGYSFEEIASKHHQIFMHETDAQSAEYKKFWQDLGAGKEMVGEFKRKTKSNQSVYIKGMYNPVCNHQGEVVKITKLAYDITSLKVEAS
jgi:PAS domain S-box-containing protein